ncbi:MAG: PQQ-binding-like beta-propeller repeat protein [Pirellulales bacterium]
MRKISFDLTRVVLVGVFVALAVPRESRAEVNWPRWGGPDGTSHSAETGLPVSWTEENIVWKAGLKGWGQSMPVVWGDRIFLTTALDGGRQRVVFCVDRRDGKTLWEQAAWTGEPEPSHNMNGHASATCATNGKVVVAFFGRGGLHAYSLDGKHLWSRDLGRFEGPWGTAASPIFYGDTVIQNCDSESPESSLVAVDYRTGETVWNTPRMVIRGWSTPVIVKTPEREELVLNSQLGVRSYNPKTGAELWWCKGFAGRGEPVPAYAHGMLFVVNGLQGDIYAVRPGGTGDVTATHRAWHTPRRAGRDLPSPVVIDKYLLACSMPGILFCYDCQTGKELWKERIGPKFSSTPLVSEGRAYFQSEEGDTIVVEPGEKMNIVGKSKLESESDELFRASLVPCQGQILIRSNKFLYAIGPKSGGAAN